MAVDPLAVDEVAVGDADLAADRVEAEGGDDRVVSRQARVADLAVGGGQVGVAGVDLRTTKNVSDIRGKVFFISAMKQLGEKFLPLCIG